MVRGQECFVEEGEEEEEEEEEENQVPVWVPGQLLFMTPLIWQSLVLFGSCLRSTVRGSGR